MKLHYEYTKRKMNIIKRLKLNPKIICTSEKEKIDAAHLSHFDFNILGTKVIF